MERPAFLLARRACLLREARVCGIPTIRTWAHARFSTNHELEETITQERVMETLRDAAKEPAPKAREPYSELSQQVKSAMRKLSHPVCFIHATSPQSKNPAGMIASSFNTVTLHPEPIVSFNVKLPSRTHAAIIQSGRFTVSAIFDLYVASHFSGFFKRKSPWKDQSIKNDDFGRYLEQGRVWAMECEWLQDKSVEIGDHVIMVGRVTRLRDGVGHRGKMQALTYGEKQFRVQGMVAATLLEARKKQKARSEELDGVMKGMGKMHGRRGKGEDKTPSPEDQNELHGDADLEHR